MDAGEGWREVPAVLPVCTFESTLYAKTGPLRLEQALSQSGTPYLLRVFTPQLKQSSCLNSQGTWDLQQEPLPPLPHCSWPSGAFPTVPHIPASRVGSEQACARQGKVWSVPGQGVVSF